MDSLPARRRLRIGIDGFNLAMRRGTGIATYARALSHCVAGLGHQVDVLYGLNIPARAPQTLREILFFDRIDHDGERKAPAAWSWRFWEQRLRARIPHDAQEIPITGRVESRNLASRLPQVDRILNVSDLFPMASRHFRRTGRFLEVRTPAPPDIMHWTYPLPIRMQGARNIYTVHDVIPLRLPYTTLDNKRHHLRLLARCLEQGDRICTVSEASRRDFLAFFPEAGDRIVNTYESIVVPPAPAGANGVPELFGLEERGYFLFFGSIEPKKNVGRILEGYLTSGTRSPLVLVGAQAWKSEQELRLLSEGGPTVKRLIRRIEYLPHALLVGLIRGARAVLFPSLYEGFGLPLLEAMALGTPVLTSREGSLPEIAGASAVCVDAYDSGDIAAGIRRLDQDEGLRATLATQGLAQAALFDMQSWQARISRLYDDVLLGASVR